MGVWRLHPRLRSRLFFVDLNKDSLLFIASSICILFHLNENSQFFMASNVYFLDINEDSLQFLASNEYLFDLNGSSLVFIASRVYVSATFDTAGFLGSALTLGATLCLGTQISDFELTIVVHNVE